MVRRLLLSGAGGFLGRNCLDALAGADWEVHAADRRPVIGISAPVRFHELDILCRSEVRELLLEVRPSHLLHLAWTGARPVYRSLENLHWVGGSLMLIEEFAAAGGSRVVALGSGAEYEWGERDCSEESTPLAGDTVYGACKSALFRLFGVLCRETGLSGAWPRPFFLYGPHENPTRFVSSVVTAMLRGEPARCTHGRQIRDFLYSRDLAGALVHLLTADFEGPVNVASGVGVSLAEVARRVGGKLGCRELLELGALPADEGEAPRVVADTRRLEREVGWRPAYDLDRGLDETIEWWRRDLGV